jgi:peptidyl-tRNA hydrolase
MVKDKKKIYKRLIHSPSFLYPLSLTSVLSEFLSFFLLFSQFVKLSLTIGIKALKSNNMVKNHKLKNIEDHYKKLEEQMMQNLQQEFQESLVDQQNKWQEQLSE